MKTLQSKLQQAPLATSVSRAAHDISNQTELDLNCSEGLLCQPKPSRAFFESDRVLADMAEVSPFRTSENISKETQQHLFSQASSSSTVADTLPSS